MNNKVFVRSTVIIVLLLLFLFIIRFPVIQVDIGDETYFLKENSFTLHWIHSVEKEPWFEVYERQGDQVLLTETYFKTFGAGVPSDGEIIESDDGYVHMKINRSMDEVNIVVSDNVETTLSTEDKDIKLYEMIDSYEEVHIQSAKLYLWNLVGGEFL